MPIQSRLFSAFEYHKDTRFYLADYRYEGSPETGWEIYRNNTHYLSLPRGYILLKTLSCGICSTDISRHNLSFPLPQITGHEVVALHNDKMVVVDINASHKHHGSGAACSYCENGLENHCPDRLTLGIDRLPGGFAPYILVPRHAIFLLPESFDIKMASVIEPFAAALHAVHLETIHEGDNIAIIGPRRLGCLLILALSLWRKQAKINFKITAIIRNEKLWSLCQLAGADEIITSGFGKYDVVFDTSGSSSGFNLALGLAKRVVHVKSTSGEVTAGLTHLTEMVIDELSLSSLPILEGKKIALDSCLGEKNITKIISEHDKREFTVLTQIDNQTNCNRVFDAVVGASVGFINAIVNNRKVCRLIKPRGTLYLMQDKRRQSLLSMALCHGVKVSTSRCGNFDAAITAFQQDSNLVHEFLQQFISGIYPQSQLPEAFKVAKQNKDAVKILIKHDV